MSSRPINTKTESVSPKNFKLGRRLVHALSNAMAIYIKACEVRLLHAGGGIPCRPQPAATQLVSIGEGLSGFNRNW